MHLDQRRAPAFDFALIQPTGISADHWKFQERMAKPYVQADALVYTAQPPFEADAADAWWTAFDALQMVDREQIGRASCRGKSVSVRVNLGGRRFIKKNKK